MKQVFYILIAEFSICLMSCKFQNNDEETVIESILPQDAVFELLADTTAGLNNDSICVFLDFYDNSCVMINGVVFDILNDTSEMDFRYIVNHPLPITSICCYDNGDMFTVSQNELYYYKDSKAIKIAELPAENMNLEKAVENKLYVYGEVQKDSIHELYLYNVDSQEIETLSSGKNKIKSVFGNGDTTYVSCNNSVFMLANGEVITILENLNVNSLLILSNKLFFATTDFIAVCYEPNKYIPFIQHGGKKLLSDNETLYILFNNGSFAAIHNTNTFDGFCSTIDSISINNSSNIK
jgi:hypothetical protein